MHKEPAIISLDIGTTTICVLAICAASGKVCAHISVPNNATIVHASADRHEQCPQTILNISLDLIRAITESLTQYAVQGIALTGQMHGVLLADGYDRPLTPLVTWRDTRTLTKGQPGALFDARRKIADIPFDRRGCTLNAGYGGATLYWLQAHGMIQTNARALTIADYIAANLSGVITVGSDLAASWGLLDLVTHHWDATAIEALSIPLANLPVVCESGKPLGVLRPAMAERLRLPTSTVILAPVGDNQASVVGVVGFRDEIVLNIGTGAQISMPGKLMDTIDGLETRPMRGQRALLVGASLCGGWSYDYLHKMLNDAVRLLAGVEIPADVIYEKMATAAKNASGNGLKIDTQFAGTRVHPELRGAITGIGTDNLTVGHLARAFAYGIVEELAAFAEAAGVLGRLPVAVSGNGARKNELVQSAIQRRFGSCRLGSIVEEAALGAAYTGGVALGLLPMANINYLARAQERV